MIFELQLSKAFTLSPVISILRYIPSIVLFYYIKPFSYLMIPQFLRQCLYQYPSIELTIVDNYGHLSRQTTRQRIDVHCPQETPTVDDSSGLNQRNACSAFTYNTDLKLPSSVSPLSTGRSPTHEHLSPASRPPNTEGACHIRITPAHASLPSNSGQLV